jgi:transcription elongation factor Elf1
MSVKADEKAQTTATETKQDKPDKVPNLLILPNADKLGEEVQALLSDARDERDLLAQSLTKRTSKTEHATRMLRTIGAIVDNPDGSGQTWAGLPIWTNGDKPVMSGKSPKEASFADIAKVIVPNDPEAHWTYRGSVARKAAGASLHKSGECDICGKSHKVGEAEYSENVDMVSTALRDAARKVGRAPVRTQAPTESDKSGKADKSPEILTFRTDQDMTAQVRQITAFLAELVKSGNTVNLDGSAQNDLLDACRAYVRSCEPVTPATAGRRTRKATAA